MLLAGDAYRSRRSSAALGIAGTSSANWSEAEGATSSGRVDFASTAIFRFWTSNGAEAVARARTMAATTGLGFQGSLRVVSEWTTRRRRAERASLKQLTNSHRPERLLGS